MSAHLRNAVGASQLPCHDVIPGLHIGRATRRLLRRQMRLKAAFGKTPRVVVRRRRPDIHSGNFGVDRDVPVAVVEIERMRWRGKYPDHQYEQRPRRQDGQLHADTYGA